MKLTDEQVAEFKARGIDLDEIYEGAFDKDGSPITRRRLYECFEDMEYRRVAYDELPGGGFLSTVWLAYDHAHFGPPPLIFETMRFPENEPCERWSTLEEAKAGHAAELKRQLSWRVRIRRRWDRWRERAGRRLAR